jgi:hypothetical protein
MDCVPLNTLRDDSARTAEGARRTRGVEILPEEGMGNLQELRWVLQDSAGMKLPPPAKKTIDLEGRLIKDGVLKAIGDRQNASMSLSSQSISTGSFRRVNR